MRHARLIAGTALAIACFMLAGCNPTWTTQGKPNNNSMPLPPDARQVPPKGTAEQSKPADDRPPASPATGWESSSPGGSASNRRAVGGPYSTPASSP